MRRRLIAASTMEDGHFRAKYEEMKLQMENKDKIQVLCFYKYISPFNTLLISGDPEPQGGKQEVEANHKRPIQQKPPVMPTKRRLRQATKLDSCQCHHINYRSVQSTKLLKWLEKGTFVTVTMKVVKESYSSNTEWNVFSMSFCFIFGKNLYFIHSNGLFYISLLRKHQF